MPVMVHYSWRTGAANAVLPPEQSAATWLRCPRWLRPHPVDPLPGGEREIISP